MKYNSRKKLKFLTKERPKVLIHKLESCKTCTTITTLHSTNKQKKNQLYIAIQYSAHTGWPVLLTVSSVLLV